MQRLTINVLLCATMLGLSARPSKASEIDKKTILTITAPVQIPGTVLQPGTYVVKRADPSTPNVIRFFDAEGDHLFATVMTIPVERSKPSGKVEVELAETRGTAPVAMRSWFYPGDVTGQEFLYPRGGNVLTAMSRTDVQGLAPLPAKESESAMTKATESEPELVFTRTEPIPSASEQNAQNVEIAQSTYSSPQPTTAAEPQPANQAPATQEDNDRLPNTAGFLPLLALLGAGALAGGTGLKAAYSKRSK